MNIAHYYPSKTVADVLEIAGTCFEPDKSLLFLDLLVKLIARDLADADSVEIPHSIEIPRVAGSEPIGDARYFQRWHLIRYFERAPETEALALRFLQAARSEWMRDPS